MDLKTIHRRVEGEGMSFLTISLPGFAKDLEKGLDQGFVDRNLFRGFAFQAGLPRFLGGFLDLIFDRSTGVLLDDPSIEAIRSVRQVCNLLGKLKADCSPERVKAAYAKYVECEKEVKMADRDFDIYVEDFSRMSSTLFRNVFSDVDKLIYDQLVLPKHGPGATADRILGNKKYDMRTWTERLERVFPMGHYAFPRWGFYLEALSEIEFLEPGAEEPVRVITVPKNAKTPRIIAMEPVYMQYMQQSILEPLIKGLEEDDISSLFLGFSDQAPNQRMAREGSISGALATLDLSEASDRVSNQHVRAMLAPHPHLSEGVDACRSRKADVLGKTYRLAKFASMGSALCFPFEAMVFLTVVFLGIERALNTRLTRKEVKRFSGKVRIYGDDIIVPVEYVHSVIESLEAFGFKVNSNKSFWTGKFRESCGKEYYNGHDVSVVKARQNIPTERKQAVEIVATVELRNHLYKGGYWQSCRWLDERIERLIPFPSVGPDSPALGRYCFMGYESHKVHPTLHHPLVKGAVVKVKLPKSEISGGSALMKWYLKRSDLPVEDRDHLLFAGRPVSVDIKTRWVRPF
nr:MAG: RNA dependent RNA polymerase [Leviviridae sp.]